ncbi:MAG TPA: DUF4169 family protein [Falsiroseomonas sp.]|jgi:hypothetical protein|nr:DUF4169 family protein [Falsiroseomonas sp.]
MAEIVNLNRVKKARTKAEATAQAAANRVKHGRDKAAKANDRAAAERRARLLDGAKRDPHGED